jgi:PAS domain S-box-containing protein
VNTERWNLPGGPDAGAGSPEEPSGAAAPVVDPRISSRQRLDALVRSSPLAVIEWDSEHRVVNWSGNAPHIFGWEASEVLGKRADEWRFVPDGDWGTVRGAMEAMDSGRTGTSRNRNYRKDGSLVDCEWYNSVILDRNGGFMGGLSLVLDTTERRRIEEALRESEENFRLIFETAPIGIFRSTVEGRFITVNAKLAGLFRYPSPEEMVAAIGNIGEQMFVDPQKRLAIIARAIETDGFVPDEIEYRRRDGSTFLSILYIRAVWDSPDRVAFLEGFVEDITERRRAEESIREAYDALEQRVSERTAELSAANDRLQELDRLKSQFLASMSHELRTPLNSIIGFTSLLRQGLSGPVNAEQKKQLDIVQTSSKHLLTLINDLLDVSRIEAGRADLEFDTFDFAAVLAEALRILKPMADRKGLETVAELPAETIPMTGDRKRTLQVLLNLVNNAIKFTEEGRVRIQASTEADRLRVVVSDTGIGIKAEHIGMLFEAFRQVDGSARRIYEGTGLGLYLCRKLLRMMGGEIHVESDYGVGSRFTFTMPLELAPESPPDV